MKQAGTEVRNPKANQPSVGADFANQQIGEHVSLEVLAEQEAEMIAQSTQTRAAHWVKVLKLNRHDMPALEKYPQMVRHAYAKRLGLNMSVSRSKWTEAERKLYDSFSANQVSNLGLIIQLAKQSDQGAQAAIALLEGKGTIPQKVAEARVLLGKPKKEKGAKTKNGDGKEPSKSDGADKWDITDLKKKSALEAVLVLIGGPGIKNIELQDVINAISLRLAKSADPLEKLLSERLAAATLEYEQKADGVDTKPEAPRTGTQG